MPAWKIALLVLTLAFSALTFYALTDVGYFGIFTYHFHSSAGWQVITDLVITCLLLISWMIWHARRTGRNPWPFVVITLAAGAFGPLLYLLTGPNTGFATDGAA